MNRNVSAMIAGVSLAIIGAVCALSAGLPPVAVLVFVVLVPVMLVKRAASKK
jgi:hypothetical protein